MAFADKAASDSAGRMGRPPLNPEDETKTTLVRLEKGIMARIDALAGKNGRAKWLRQAALEKLAREKE